MPEPKPPRYTHWLDVDRRVREARKSPARRVIGRRSKAKGKTGEKELAARLEELTGVEWNVRARDRDVEVRDPNSPWASLHVEVKRRKRHGVRVGLCQHPAAPVVGFIVRWRDVCWFADHSGPDRWWPIGGRPKRKGKEGGK